MAFIKRNKKLENKKIINIWQLKNLMVNCAIMKCKISKCLLLSLLWCIEVFYGAVYKVKDTSKIVFLKFELSSVLIRFLKA